MPTITLPQNSDDVERANVEAALAACGGNVTDAAQRLGWHRSTLFRRLNQYRAEDKLAVRMNNGQNFARVARRGAAVRLT